MDRKNNEPLPKNTISVSEVLNRGYLLPRSLYRVHVFFPEPPEGAPDVEKLMWNEWKQGKHRQYIESLIPAKDQKNIPDDKKHFIGILEDGIGNIRIPPGTRFLIEMK